MNAEQIASSLLQGQVGDFGAVGHVGDMTNVTPVYPGGRVGTPMVQAYYPGQVGLAAVDGGPSNQQQVNYSAPQYVAGDVTYLGFAATTIPAGSIGTPVNVSTTRPFTPQKMGCPSTTIGLLISQVNISGTNLLANTLGVPVELVSEVSTFPQIIWPTLDTATGVQFIVANPTGADLTFSGAFYGTQVRR